LVNLTQSLWVFNRVAERLEESVADAAEMTEVILREPEVQDVPRPKKLRIDGGNLDFAGVNFAYEKHSGEREFFQNLSLHIPSGQKVGLVGPSGGGKTTFAKLLLRFMDVNSGQILLDGQDISHVSQDDLRRHITYVPQEPLLF